MGNFLFAAQAVIPVFLLIALGWFLRKRGWIDKNFIRIGSRLVFTFSLPALLILKISTIDSSLALGSRELWIIPLVAFGFWFLSFLFSTFLLPPQDRGVFAQGSFRSNLAIIGIAVIYKVLGDTGVQKAAVYIALLIPLFNILSTVGILLPLRNEEESEQTLSTGAVWARTGKKIVTNPLMIAIAIGFILLLSGFRLPVLVQEPLEYISRLSLPLALICIGGGIDFSHLKETPGPTITASLIKVILMPLAALMAAPLLGLDTFSTVVLVILFGCPTAVSSFPMAQALGGNQGLAANIVALTTLLSIFSLGILLTFFGSSGYLGG